MEPVSSHRTCILGKLSVGSGSTERENQDRNTRNNLGAPTLKKKERKDSFSSF